MIKEVIKKVIALDNEKDIYPRDTLHEDNINSNSDEDIDYQKIFDCIKDKDIIFLKNENMINEFFKLKDKLEKKGFKYNDIMWSILNQLKLKYENTDDYYMLANIIGRMNDILIEEKRFKLALEFLYCEFYLVGLAKNRVKNVNEIDFGTTRMRNLKRVLEITNSNLNYNDFNSGILRYIPSKYDETNSKKIYNCIVNQ